MRLKKYNFFYKLFFITCFFTTTFFTQNAWGQTAQSLKYSANPTSANLTSANGWTKSGLGSDYSDNPVKLKFDDATDNCILKIADPPGKLTYYLKGNSLSGSYNYEVYESTNGSSWSLVRSITSGISSSTGGSLWTDNLSASTRYIKWVYTTKSSGNIGMGTITILPANPTTSSISPSSKNAGDAAFTLTVNGTNFISGKSTVKWGGSNRTTTFVSSTELTAPISASDISSAGTASVTVTTTDAESASNAQTFTINASGSTPPSLTAAPSATVDAAFDVTFTDDATWRSAITSITVGGTTLTAGYSVSSGKITFTPSASTPASLLQTAGTKSISVQATGYSDATVSQAIGAGAPNKLSVQTQPVGNATYNATTLATQPVIQVQDQYGNVTNAVSTITVNAAAVEGTWSLGGTNSINITAGNSSGSFTNLTATNTNGADITNAASISFTATGLTSATSNSFSIKILYQEPTENPTISGVVNSSSPTSAIDVSWSSVTANGYIVTRKVAAQPEAPTDGTSYTVGSAISSSTVVYVGTGTSFTDNSLSAGTQYRYRVYAYNGAGTGTYNYKTSPSPTADTTYTISNSPTAHAASFTATATSATNINLAFSAASTIPANGYLILRKASAFVAADYPTDGEAPNVGADVGPNGAKVNAIISSDGITTASYTANADETWYFLLVPFNWNGSNGVTRNYYTDPTIPTANATTSSKLSDVIAVASSSPATISSIINDAAPLTSSTGVQVWQITIRDGGASMNDADALPTKVNAITFTAGSGNAVAWNTAIKTAALFDGSTLVATASSITATQIEFTSLSIEVADNSSKTYSLRISLNESLGSGNDDGDDFQFQLSNTNITTANDGTSSAITNFSVIQTANNTENVIDVVATKLLFTLQPTNVAASPNKIDSVKVNATDVNGNLDAGFTATVNLQSTGSVLKNAPLSQSAVAGNVKFTNLEFFVPEEGIKLFATSTGLTTDTSSAFNVTRIFDTLSLWTFETSVPATAGPHTAEGGINGGNATNPHSSGGVTYSNFVGNGSAESFSSDKWSAGDYYQFTTSTSGYEDIFLTIHQTSSNSGPKNFKVQYSTDGSSFTDLSGGSYSIANDSWSSSGSPKAESIYSFDLSSISSLDNKASIYIRLTQVGTTSVDGGTVATGGTNRVDNVTITGYPMTYTWTGSGGDNKWTTTSNWDCNCGKTPSSNHVVVIPNGSNVILDANYTAKLLTLQATSTLKIAPLKTLTVAGIVNLNNQSVTIQSDATGTGSIGKITGSLNDATNVTVERYISASGNRAYRLLAPSVNTSTSIKANWMEGVNNTDVSTNSSPNAGYGTHITGAGGATNGFDPTQNNQASLFNLIGNAWVAASNTSGTLDAKTGYLLFVRGNRDNINTINTTTGSSNTTLRATGTLLTGTQTFSSLPASSFSLVTNPYVSAIDWGSIYTANSSNFENFVTIWDPNIGTRGGYVSIQNDGTKSVASVLTKSIQSGQAFFVKTKTGGTKTLTITENNKDSGNNNLDAYRSGNIAEQLSIMLQFTANSKNILADGVVAKFANNYQNIVDENDATQIANFDEDISLMREEKKLSIESRGSISTADTLFIGTQNLKVAQANYRWVIAPENFATIKLQAHLQDNYTNTSKPISLSDTTIIAFSVNNDDASKAIDRFRIVFSERQTYYSKANNLSANDLNSWSATKDGTGISPASFDNNALFVIQQGHVLNLNSSLNLSQSNLQIEQNAGINNTGNLYIGNDIENNGSITGTGITEINGTTKQTISGVGKISNIKLNNTLGANIDVESKVFVLDSYIPTAGILTTNGNLVLVSNETTTASITTGAASGNYLRGNVMVERFIPAKATRKWSFVASPVTQSIAQSWQQQIHITGAGNGGSVCPELAPHNNGFDATVTNTPSMYSYDASQTSGQRWIALNNTLTENLTAGKAFRVNIRGDRNLGCSLLDGTINTVSAVTLQATGLINIENHNAGNFNISYPNTLADNYVFVGNPYPSAINFNTFRTDNSANIANNYAIYIPTNNAGVYTYWDANTQTFTGGTGYDDITGNEIVSGQAFFVQAKNIGNVTLTFTEEQKVNTHNTGYFKPKNYPEQIKINYLQNNVKVDEAIIRFVDDENISNTSFNNLDIPSMNSGTYISSLKSTKGMVVQTRNLTTLKQDEVWLNIGATASGTYQLNFSDFDNFANTDIYLTDHYTNTTQNIRENAVYEFSIDKDNAATKGVARFSISFNRTIQPEYVSNVIKLYPNPANKQVTIELPQTADNTITYQIKVTDIAGKIVMEQKQLSGTHQLSLDKLTTGTYLIEITDSKGIKTTEKLVKQ